ncbi:MAG: MoxR family ATPase [Succinivibrionaceae bacterium]|nr:MoxR family ATPase [Pseudomonadota bacterium]MDD6547173.1 MoxR family ATPase [Pseudomonadota bacterium]MDY3144924.1 MoxR family ATPase [Succinivibrionaceae bacterium]MDY6275030.1 MoxR family ATPase [Succinivibrionaceae bacterium]MDY6336667.1 MoxR family ATPase [Succinivibrionaceae bacterium]
MNREKVQDVRQFLAKRVIGQPDLIDGLMLALLADGHIIVEGPPGLAKTRAIKELAKCVEGSFHRVQFTPDLLPADITGTDIYHPEDGSFVFQPGPIFHHLLLADEINRAPAKVQSALLEAMAEHQITIGRKTYRLPDLFLVMATQNPIEQEGTYPLPEAQLDRFMLHIKIDYPDAQSELEILRLNSDEAVGQVNIDAPRLTQSELFSARNEVSRIEISDSLEQYIVSIVMTTRNPQVYDSDLGRWLSYGVSSRASIALARCAKARAWLSSRNYVTPDDIQICAYPVLRHRLVLSMEAEADNVTPTDVIEKILKLVAVS